MARGGGGGLVVGVFVFLTTSWPATRNCFHQKNKWLRLSCVFYHVWVTADVANPLLSERHMVRALNRISLSFGLDSVRSPLRTLEYPRQPVDNWTLARQSHCPIFSSEVSWCVRCYYHQGVYHYQLFFFNVLVATTTKGIFCIVHHKLLWLLFFAFLTMMLSQE